VDLTPRDEVLMLGKTLAIGYTVSGRLCPFCGGGQSKEHSFSVTRTEKIKVSYKCHRNKCGEEGHVMFDGSGASTAKIESFKPKVYQGYTQGFEYDDLAYLEKTYGIDLQLAMKAGWCRADGPGFALCMPVFSPLGKIRGVMIKREFPDGTKDCKGYKQVDEPWICWYRRSTSDVVVVEDQISALKGATFVTTASLCGVGLSQDKFDEIQATCKGTIWLALDPDARGRTFDYLKQFKSQGSMKALMLPKDLKNMTYKEIRELGEPFNSGVV
jgi:hypothetical protein